MPIFSSVIRSVDPSAVAKSVPIKSLDVNVKPLSSQPIRPIRPIDPSAPKPARAAGAGVGSTVALGGLALSSMIPSILNSSAVSTAINAGAIAGTVDNVVGQITSSPENMAVAGAVALAAIFLLSR